MTAQLFLFAPTDPDPAARLAHLGEALEAGPAALLLSRAGLDDARYRAFVKAALPLAQPRGAAVLVEDDIALARAAGADGVHVFGDVKAVREAVSALKPDFIVGAGPARTRHEAMVLGELDIDYVLFGAPGAVADPETRALAGWWAETFEVPAVLAGAETDDAAGCEFAAPADVLPETMDPAP